jgi:hypothetical protein
MEVDEDSLSIGDNKKFIPCWRLALVIGTIVIHSWSLFKGAEVAEVKNDRFFMS